MNKFSIIFSLALILFCQSALAKVELYPPKVLEPNSDGFVRIQFSGRAAPNAKVSINPDASIVVKSPFFFKHNQTPNSLKEFTKNYYSNLVNKKEGIFRLPKSASIYGSPNLKGKGKALTKTTLLWGNEVNKDWISVDTEEPGFVLKKQILKPNFNTKELGTTPVKTTDDGEFEFIANLPVGTLQVLFFEDAPKTGSFLFALDVTPKSVTSSTKFLEKRVEPEADLPLAQVEAQMEKQVVKQQLKKVDPPVVAKDLPKPETVKPAPEIAEGPLPEKIQPTKPRPEPRVEGKPVEKLFSAVAGLGVNYHDYKQIVTVGEDIGFNNISSPGLALEFIGILGQWGFRASNVSGAAKLKSAASPYTLLSSDYTFSTTELGVNYHFTANPKARSFGLGLGMQMREAPFLSIDGVNNVEIESMNLNFLMVSFFFRPSNELGYSFPLEINFLAPAGASGPSGSEVEAAVSLQFKFGLRKQWTPTFYSVAQGSIEQTKTNYALGTHEILNSQMDLKAGFQF